MHVTVDTQLKATVYKDFLLKLRHTGAKRVHVDVE